MVDAWKLSGCRELTMKEIEDRPDMLLRYERNKSSATSKPLIPFYTRVTKYVVVTL